ncbi:MULTISPECIES: putative quinol monooxygenase [Amycolatopsis]|uniref:Quinol monooxygenase YgiN n=1 Tax=Amycolatopsis thermoflava TaxID=84480 RepID=A0A3N2GW47_9PSEU|nr:antibiotic biosynthesis monooxygenase family protein [Amycolatopsis thermoflava]ROS40783.1 quinol monooxygenase YgiN [Amycolatopsis thermoflava]
MNQTDAVVVIATIEAAEGKEAQVEEALRTAVRAVHPEPGCERYALHRDAKSPTTFVMVEKWASGPALGAHGKGAALAELNAALDGLLAKPLDVQLLTPLPDGDGKLGAL